MITVEHSVVINRPIEKVFEFMIDIENAPQWRQGLVEVKKLSDELVVGARASEVLQFLGRRMETTYEITEYEPNKKFGFKTTSGPIPMEGGFNVEPAEGGTKVSFKIQGEAGGFFRLAEPILARMVRRQVETDYANLKDLLEAQAGSG